MATAVAMAMMTMMIAVAASSLLGCSSEPQPDAQAASRAAHAATPTRAAPRIVSLMPPVSETLYEIGAGEQVVGRSDYCAHPPQITALPACGSALTPNSEAIVKLRPTLILANSSEATARDDLRVLGRAVFLPWLTTEEMIDSTRKLGALTGRQAAADALANALSAELLSPPDRQGPRVLLVMLPEPGKLGPVSFLRPNSVHGRMLRAAGGQNAVEEDISGVPELSLERVIALDPEIIILIGMHDDLPQETRARLLSDWARLTPLTAVRDGRIGILSGAHFYGAGRRLLRATRELRAEIARLAP